VGIIPTMSFIRKRKKNGRVYLEEVESVRVGEKVVQRHIRYVGKEVDGNTVISASISNIAIDEVKQYGPLLVLKELADEINLSRNLGEYGDELLSLAFAHCIDYKSINEMSRWFERTDLNTMLNLDGLTERRLLDALDSIEKQGPEDLQLKIFEDVKSVYGIDPKCVIYDVTNTYFYGTKCPLGKAGKDKEGVKGRPLVQIGLGVTQKEGIPMFHKTFDGNISDSRTLHDLITSVRKYNINKGMMIYDRGITSSENVREIKALKWDTICGLASNNVLKNITRELLATTKTLVNIRQRVKLNDSVFYAYSQDYTLGQTKGRLIICYNEQKEKDLRESRYDEIQNAQSQIAKGKSVKEGLAKFFNQNGQINTKAVNAAEEFDGFSYVFSTKKASSQEILTLYFQDKDIVEKSFQSIKGVVRVRPIRHWLYNRVIAHIFICYLSYLLLSLLKLRLKSIGISPVEALRELDSVYRVYVRDKRKGFKIARTVVLSKKQEGILKAVSKDLVTKCSG
jgi:transposase